ncbi:MAG: hypothetical protein J6M53_06495 [Bacteroidaceae bacterium]|nr:hypothetical protein [Bacteroidaceae bacterium]
MKKFLLLTAFLVTAASLSAQQTEGTWTLNTRLYTSNYFSTTIYNAATLLAKHFAFKDNEQAELWANRIVPRAELIFPIGMGKRGFKHSGQDIYGPYHYAFGNPFKHLGDCAVGLDASFKPGTVGVYAGAYYKSQEIVFRATKDNLRGHYFQPRAGIVLGVGENTLEAGAFYDVVAGCSGSVADTDKGRLKGGWGLDFALGINTNEGKSKTLLQFSMPLHNFLDRGYAGQQGMKRKVGYITVTQRIFL